MAIFRAGRTPSVEGSHLGDITYDDDLAVPDNGVTTITLPLRFGWSGVGSAARAALGYGDLTIKTGTDILSEH